ncbi:hypothetical protein HVIM_04212 [Roseomonas mucosa]|nr:hypothetical protein HVIM_04212 [Roseomonas mucosa]QDD98917.1 hypothetical protein ADP8_04212 [Roseomonas mucosa]UZO91109.1 Hypothetical protein RMP42_04212 [Roseomonas mucosa]
MVLASTGSRQGAMLSGGPRVAPARRRCFPSREPRVSTCSLGFRPQADGLHRSQREPGARGPGPGERLRSPAGEAEPLPRSQPHASRRD